VKKSNVYTRGGDTGDTSLVSGNRLSKGDSRICLYGEVDELNSVMGVAIATMSEQKVVVEEIPFLEKNQSLLFDLGSNLACEIENRSKYKLPQVSEEFILKLEKEIDRIDSELEPLKLFILPGGSVIAAQFHVARTVCRRVERSMVHFMKSEGEELPINSLKYINRLSDYLFIFSRYVNLKLEIKETTWNAKE